MTWIKIKDKLPPEDESVLVYDAQQKCVYTDHMITNPYLEDSPYVWYQKTYQEWDHITHWMQLPEAPKEEEPSLNGRCMK